MVRHRFPRKSGIGTKFAITRFIISGQNHAGMGYIGGTYNRPREWYLRAGFKF